MGWTLRRIAIGQIVELTNAKVRTASVDIDFDGSILVEKLVVRPHKEGTYDDTMLKAETVYARFGIGSLLLLRPRLKEINVHDFVFNAVYNIDTDRWNIGTFKFKVPSKGGYGKMPLIHLEEGTLRYSKVSNGQIKTVSAMPIDARFEPAKETLGGYRFGIRTGTMAGGFGQSNLTGRWRPGKVTITGGISSAGIREFERTFEINVMAAELDYDADANYSLKLRAKDLLSRHRPAGDIFTFEGPAFIREFGVFTPLQKLFARFDPQGRFDINLEEMSGNLRRLGESTLRGSIYCKDISICDRRFPYPIEHISGWLDLTERGVELKNLQGEHGDVKVAFNGWSKHLERGWRYDIKVTSDNMALDDDLYNALNVKQKKFWSAYSPRGLAVIDYHVSRDQARGRNKTLAVELVNAEANYRHFPYPLKNLTGNLLFEHDSIMVADVVSQFDGRRICIDGKVTDCHAVEPLYDITITARDIPLDSTLAASLSDSRRGFYDQLDLAGVADAEIKVLKSKGASGPANVTANISLKKASLQPNDFPLLISDASSEVTVTRDLVRVHNLTGRCGEGAVSLTGRIWPGSKAVEPRYHLVLRGKEAKLDDELFCLLPGALREVVSELQPEGKIDYSVDFSRTGSAKRPEYRIAVGCLGNSFNFEPLRHVMRNIGGSLAITTESTQPDSVAGAGNVETTGDTATVKVTGLLLQTDGDKSDSRFDLDLQRIRIFDAEDGEKYVDFAGVARFKGCSLDILPAVTELDGFLRIEGLYKIGEGFCRGKGIFSADSVRIKGKCLSGVKANLVYAAGRKSWLSNDLMGDCYEGKFAGKFELRQSGGEAAEYILEVGLNAIDLKKFLSDTETEEARYNGETEGIMSGSLSIGGIVGEGSSRIGRCRLTVTDMQLGKLSPLAKLLCVLKLTEPGDFAFDQMVVDSYVDGKKLYFEDLDLSGEALAFKGSGWMDLESENVDMVLFARGERLAAAEPSVFQSLTEGVGQALVQMELTGNFNDPKVTTTTLPVLKDTLGIFGTKRATQNR